MSRMNKGTIYGGDSYKSRAKSEIMRQVPGEGLDMGTPTKKLVVPKMAEAQA